MTHRALIASAHRVVVKVGSSSLTTEDGRLDAAALKQLVDVLAERRLSGREIVLVTSAAVAAGIGPLDLPGKPRDIATAQAAASVGQGILMAHYTRAFHEHSLTVGQLLLTAEDTVRRSRYRNVSRSIERLLALGAVPIINENDALVADELRFGDNDRLAALVSHLVRADALILLTDVDGLYDGPPSREGTKRIPEVRSFDEIAGVEVTARGSSLGTGGMVTKLQSAAIATGSGVPVVLTKAENARAALAGEPVGTWFAAMGKRRTLRHLWLEHAASTKGQVVLDDGAVAAILSGRASLLPAGITETHGDFQAGDPIELTDKDGQVIARGIVEFDASEIGDLLGRTTGEIREEFGEAYGREIVHRDDLVLVRRLRSIGL